MDSDNPTPRVNFELMQRYINQRVLLVGEIDSIENGRLIVKTSDKASVMVHASNMQPYDSPFVEILGTVVDSKTLREESHTNCGESFDLNLYNELLKLASGKHLSLFLP